AEPVLLALLGREVDAPADRVRQVELSLDHVRPGRARRVLEVGEPHLRARVERVDGHLAVGRAGDLDAAVLEAGPGTGDLPRAVGADALRVVEEPEVAAVVDRLAEQHPPRQSLLPAPDEEVVEAVGLSGVALLST